MLKKLLIILSIITIELSTVKVYFESVFDNISYSLNDTQEDNNQESPESKLINTDEVYCDSVLINFSILFFFEPIRPHSILNENLPLSFLQILSPPPR